MEVRIAGVVVNVMGGLREAAARAGYIVRHDADLPESEVLIPDDLPPQIQIADEELSGLCERGRAYAEEAIIGQAMLKVAEARLGPERLGHLLRDIVAGRVAYQLLPPILLSLGLPCLLSGLFMVGGGA